MQKQGERQFTYLPLLPENPDVASLLSEISDYNPDDWEPIGSAPAAASSSSSSKETSEGPSLMRSYGLPVITAAIVTTAILYKTYLHYKDKNKDKELMEDDELDSDLQSVGY